jgi:hypothetical protein
MIPQPYRDNFTTLHRAFDAGDACLLECHEQATGKPVYIICAVNRCGEDYDLVPFAQLFNGNPYEQLLPPGELQNNELLDKSTAEEEFFMTISTSKHTPEPWEHGDNGIIYGQCGEDDVEPPFVCVVIEDSAMQALGMLSSVEEANARRIVAAVNACQSIITEVLEQGIVAELLQLLMLLADHLETPPHDLTEAMRALRLREARVTIAKANGRAA